MTVPPAYGRQVGLEYLNGSKDKNASCLSYSINTN